MNTVLRHIEYLLSDHNCVIVPGLGALLATRYDAHYDDGTGLYYAPTRRYTFNSALTTSDGMLVSSVARSLNLDYDDAARLVDNDVAQLKTALDRDGEISLGRAGRLEKSNGGTLSFVPYDRDCLSPLSGWSGTLNIDRAGTLSHYRERKIEAEKQLRPSRFRRFVRTAAGAAAAILIAIVASTPITVNNTAQQASMSLPAVSAPKAAEAPKADIRTVEPKAVATPVAKAAVAQPEPVAVAEPQKNAAPVAAKPATPDVTESTTTSSQPRFVDTDRYAVIVASLATRADADKFIQQYSSRTPSLTFGIDTTGRYFRVYAATGSTKEQAQKQTHNALIVKNFSGAWVTGI